MSAKPKNTGASQAEVDASEALLEAAWAHITPPTARRLLIAAVHTFAERGYHATTTRDIASRAGMSPAAVYIHYPAKEELLFQISKLGHQLSFDVMDTAAASTEDPVERLQAVVRAFARWHAEYHTTARVVQYELSALTPEHFSEIIELRRTIERTMRTTIDHGIRSGHFHAPDPDGTALAALSLCIDVARWYQVDGKRTPEQVGQLYAELVTRMLVTTG